MSKKAFCDRVLDRVQGFDASAAITSISRRDPDDAMLVRVRTVPATASAVLALYAPALAPFMGDEAMEAVPGSQPCSGNSSAYTEDAYFDFRDALVDRASELESLGWTGCTAEAVGRALWAAAMLSIGKGKKVSKNFQLPPLPAAAAGTAAQEDAAEAEAAESTDEPSKDGGPTKKRRKTLVG